MINDEAHMIYLLSELQLQPSHEREISDQQLDQLKLLIGKSLYASRVPFQRFPNVFLKLLRVDQGPLPHQEILWFVKALVKEGGISTLHSLARRRSERSTLSSHS